MPAQYQLARVELAKKALTAGENKEAISLLEECLEYPHHLGEGKLYGAQENDFYYFLGCAYEGLGQHDKAVECWEQAIIGPTEPLPPCTTMMRNLIKYSIKVWHY